MRVIVVGLCALAVLSCDNRDYSTGPSPFVTPPPVIQWFTADATRLGGPNGPFLDTYLRWDVLGTADTRCRIDAVGQPSVTIGNVPLAGFVQVRPGTSRDYALMCTNAGGTVIRVVSILVG